MGNNLQISCITSMYRCEEYLKDFLLHLKKIENLNEIEFIFIHNDPTLKEKTIINEFINNNFFINIVYKEVPLEGLYSSWNRAVKIAKGKFITIWNVDDIRYSGSLKLQVEVLEKNEKIKLVYGNKEIVRNKITKYKEIHIAPDSNENIKQKKFLDGAFIMWKKSVHEKIGYFDEQFMISGDQDFWYRLTSYYSIKKVNSVLGVFMDIEGEGLSKSRRELAKLEKNVIVLRYGFWTTSDLFTFFKTFKKYKIGYLLYDDKYQVLTSRKSFKLIKVKYFLLSILYSFSVRLFPHLFNSKASKRYF